MNTYKIDTYNFFVDLCRAYEKYTSKIDKYIILVDSYRTYKIDTYKNFVDSSRTYKKFPNKIETYKILVDLCRTNKKDIYNFLRIHVGHTKSTRAK